MWFFECSHCVFFWPQKGRLKPRKGIESKVPRRSRVEISIVRTSQRSPLRPKGGQHGGQSEFFGDGKEGQLGHMKMKREKSGHRFSSKEERERHNNSKEDYGLEREPPLPLAKSCPGRSRTEIPPGCHPCWVGSTEEEEEAHVWDC